MRELHVVGVTDDGGHLLLASRRDATKGTHVLAVDGRLQAALKGTLPPPGSTGAAESALSPKEIQARLRAGETPEQVARVAGVAVTRVLRYAGPVMSERARIVDQARAAVMSKARAGASAVPLGVAADLHLAETPGLKPDTVDWTARRRDDGSWVVRLAFVARGRSRMAEWAWDPAERAVGAMDTFATRLGYVADGRRTPKSPAAKPASSARARTGGRKTAGTKSATAKRGTAKKAAPTSSARAAATKRTSTKTTSARTASAKTTTARSASAKPAASRRGRPPAEAPLPRDHGVRPAGDGKRAAVPTWSDVLLGTRTPAPVRGNGKAAGPAKSAGRRTRRG